MPRRDDRPDDALRPLRITRAYTRNAPGSVLVETGGTRVLCTAALVRQVPDWLAGKGAGWLTAEYGMLPGSTPGRKARDRGGRIDGRSVEIQRLIGRSLRTVVDRSRFPDHTLHLDCDVLDADAGTRTASVTGAFVAAVDAVRRSDFAAAVGEVFRDSVAAVSVGVVGGRCVLDLDYPEDAGADVDMNLVGTGSGAFIEVQGTGEKATFDRAQLLRLLDLGAAGIATLTAAQKDALGDDWPVGT